MLKAWEWHTVALREVTMACLDCWGGSALTHAIVMPRGHRLRGRCAENERTFGTRGVNFFVRGQRNGSAPERSLET